MDNQTALLWQLIATVAGVVVLVWYSLETRWLRQETNHLLQEARIQNETALRPIIDFYFHTTGVGGYQQQSLKVRNVGRGPAFGLYATPSKLEYRSSISMVLPESVPADTEGFCHFNVKDLLGESSGSVSSRDIFLSLKTTVGDLPLSMRVTYQSATGKRYLTTLIVTADGELAKLVFGGSDCMDDGEEL